ncbi:MAG: heat-inducible transcription repressor HrcA [Thermomicrobiales bacterium]|nr:heat-inducible transcription repressor HrcA [Thermomicrobiales bacterium]
MMQRPQSETQSASQPSAMLTPRQQAILKLIVHEFVQSGRPVGSKTLTERYAIGYSAATIRNEMAELEAAGYIQHLHTSGGRVPTDVGYRYFVHNLMGAVELPPGEQIMISHQFRQAEDHLEGWMDLAATVMAEIAGNVSVVTAPRTAIAKLRHLELISLQPRIVLLILVTFESTVRQVMIHVPESVEQAELSRLADVLVAELRGLSSDEIASRSTALDPLAMTVVDQVVATLRTLDSADQTAIRHSGLENILGQPDMLDADLQSVMGLLRGGGFLSAVLPQLGRDPDVQVFIGDQGLPDEFRRFGVVVATYGVDDVVTGVLGVLGPMRMSYWRSISTVRYMSRLMSDLMADLYPRLDH